MKSSVVEKKNDRFDRMSAAKKRMSIAMDILKQIKRRLYVIEQGNWLSVHEGDKEEKVEESGPVSESQRMLLGARRTVVHESAPATCNCCAIGAACASAIRLFNKHEITGNQIDKYREAKDILLEYFEADQCDLIEAAFEQRIEIHHVDAGESEMDKAIRFGERYNDDTKRAQAIFNNILRNKGTFKP